MWVMELSVDYNFITTFFGTLLGDVKRYVDQPPYLGVLVWLLL
jgi:hypothetical protein